MIKEVLSQDKLNLTFVHGLLRHRDCFQRITAGDWDYIDQVSLIIFYYIAHRDEPVDVFYSTVQTMLNSLNLFMLCEFCVSYISAKGPTVSAYQTWHAHTHKEPH